MLASILHLEDNDLDAELVRERLIAAGLRVRVDRATNRKEFVRLIEGSRYDLVLADFQVPGFDGFAALELARGTQPDAPFVFLSGAMGEEVAIETLKRGATDYILKQRLARLPAVIDRALAEARERAERKEVQERLRATHATTALLRAAVESANDAVIITEASLDAPGPRIEYVNSAFERMTGYSSAEALGKTPRILQGPKTSGDLLKRMRRDLKENQEFNGETTNYRKDGTEYVVEWRITPVRNDAGEVHKWVAVQRDVTERRRAELELREADRRKDEFLATLAHELRNPLAPIRNGLAVLKASEEHGGAEILTMMDRQLSHMVRLVDDLLDVSRVISGKVALKPEMVSIQSVVESAVETSRPLIESGGHRLLLSIPEKPLLLRVDPTRIAQVISNLLNNSAKYSPDGGLIELKVEEIEEDVVFHIRDQGVGIPTEMLPRVFELFTQVGRSLDRAQGGLGIGLSLVKRLIEMHNGHIEAASEGPGSGSTFTVRLPLARERRRTPRATSVVSSPSVSRRILVVDDNIDGAASMAMMLRLCGHDTHVAHNGYEALESARNFEPDVVLLDIGMPGMSGYEVAERGRADGTFADTCLIAVTGWGSQRDKERAREAGFDFHLTKPVEASAVTRLLGELSAPRNRA